MDLDRLWALAVDLWPHLVAGAAVVVALVASGHVVLYKRDSRAAIGWVGLIWLVPLVGAGLYVLLGINRLQRRASRVRGGATYTLAAATPCTVAPEELGRQLESAGHLAALARLVGELTARPLIAGNAVEPLVNGDQAYPAMLEAIERAEQSIGLSTYIFDHDETGRQFADALARAAKRGVAVRVLIDDIGARYSWRPIDRSLRAAGVPVARFLRSLIPGWSAYANLRSHRKLLIVDGQTGFTGGMNIRDGHVHARRPKHPIVDLHFRFAGPVVAHFQEVFAGDWAFATDEILAGDRWLPTIEPVGQVAARGISSGPDQDLAKRRLTLLGAIAVARSEVVVVTPYFLPDEALVRTLDVAALRGVDVHIVLPEKNNLTLVQWASMAGLWQVLERDCKVWLSPPPFDHTKLMIVDRAWALVGSSNWDARSLRLNFEFDVECYDFGLAQRLSALALGKRQAARQLTLADVDGRSLPVRLRDGLARLLTPYL